MIVIFREMLYKEEISYIKSSTLILVMDLIGRGPT